MGAGRVVYQDLTRIDKAIRDGELVREPRARGGDGPVRRRPACPALHRAGLRRRRAQPPAAPARADRDGGAARSVPRVFVHAITDGRDASPTGSRALPAAARGGDARGRRRPDRHGRRALLRDGPRQAVGAHEARLRRDRRTGRRRRRRATALAAVHASYEAGVTDEFIRPIVIVDADGAAGRSDPRRRLGRLLQLPRGPRAAADARASRSTTSTASSARTGRASTSPR